MNWMTMSFGIRASRGDAARIGHVQLLVASEYGPTVVWRQELSALSRRNMDYDFLDFLKSG